MFKSIRTSEFNKQIITELTTKLGFGVENIIARIAFAYSLKNDGRLNLEDIQDSKGKEYSKNVLFGEYSYIYIALICQNYKIYKSNKEIPRYIKMHIDNGLAALYENVSQDGIEFLIGEIEGSLAEDKLF